MNIEISKAEISSRIFLKWEYNEQKENRNTKIKASSDAPIHEDLEEAFQALVPHFALLTEMKKKPELAKVIDLGDIPEDLLKKFKVKGLTIEDSKGTLYYKISGLKHLSNGKSISFETPKTDRGDGDDAYEFFNDLDQKVEVIKEEIIEYMGGKQGVNSQASMDFEDDDFNPEVDDKDSSVEGEKDFATQEEAA